ncbi:serine/threonine-protein phosphatase PGAM5, mitochondrial isoform X2 [Eurytemora carolleeae]|uniref:serine/threonine-protein phosphatase PGAM5, mitochondrial isoform X2 n=1 Tax=Eurytemora carolleeae TaxID=1294199 RepID=UPI000C762B48|nr:serine/threonine-protein phosphatase PGAM5, mitochondrial isoform X2 [Eurytemora carolleeae]|eukprot:XP_023338968.1 serine/threonine-protein phosphatase PGAM5, mitochondrial-like isoform X2 [Eurytemora affinis]
MARFRKLKNICLGVGAIGGTAAVFAVVVENYLGGSWFKLRTQLIAEADENKKNAFKKWDNNWDFRDVKDNNNNNNKIPTASRNIILVRHGHYNLDGKDDKERYLTALGLEQAKITGARLAELNLPYTYIARSRMTRAIETANLIKEALPTVPLLPEDGMLIEGEPVEAEPDDFFIPQHEYETDGGRIEAAFRKYFHRADVEQTEDSYELIVCHANVIRYFLCRALQLPPEAWLRISLKHASYTWLVVRPDGEVHTRGIGESGHFPKDKLSTTYSPEEEEKRKQEKLRKQQEKNQEQKL